MTAHNLFRPLNGDQIGETMQYTKLGQTGITVSRLCLGCMSYGGGPQPAWARPRDWALGMEEAREHFALAIEAGITFFDTLS